MADDGLKQWEGLDGLGEDILRGLRSDAQVKVVAAGALLAGVIKRTLSGQRHGRVYRVPSQARGSRRRARRSVRTYTASAPGEAPAVLFGNLRNSIGFSEPVWDGWSVSVEVGPGLGVITVGPLARNVVASYARILEWGGVTRRGVRILPRPYMEPSALRAEPRIEKLLAL